MRPVRCSWALAVLLMGCPAKNGTPDASTAQTTQTTAPNDDPAPATLAPTDAPKETRVIETIEETTVGDLEGVAVPMGSMLLSDTYALPDGSTKTGVTCNLALPSGSVWAGLGSVVQAGDSQWEIVAIEKERGNPGSVTLAKL
ncbi:MAG: hypothetical protein ACI9MC_000415 [Kiritimatiellia bacterium]|jgi:hypothetical protein